MCGKIVRAGHLKDCCFFKVSTNAKLKTKITPAFPIINYI
jgi:hypothetical protein